MYNQVFESISSKDFLEGRDFKILKGAHIDSRNWIVFYKGMAIIPWTMHMIHVNNNPVNCFKVPNGTRIRLERLHELSFIKLSDAAYCGGNSNIYHYTIDYIGSMYYLDRHKSDISIYPWIVDASSQWQLQLINLYAPDGASYFSCRRPTLIEVDTLVVPRKSFDWEGKNINPDWIEWAQGKMSKVNVQGNSHSRIYISRNRSRSRRIRNEEELTQRILTLGFNVYYPEEMTFADQIRLFKGAKIIVGPTGAAFTNIAYSPPGTRLIEFMPNGSWRPQQISQLAKHVGVVYEEIACNGTFEDKEFSVDSAVVMSRLEGLSL